MIFTLVRRIVTDRWRFLIIMTLATVVMAVMTSSLYSSVGVEYDEILEELPAAVISMLGDADMSTPAGWLQVELFSFVAPGLVLGAAISIAASSVAGAEQDGRLNLIVSGPVARRIVVLSGAVATLVAAVAVATGLFFGILVGSALGGLDIGVGEVLSACANLALLGVAVGWLALAAGAATGRRSTASGVGAAVAVVSYLVYSFFPLSSALKPFAKVSLWHPFAANQPLINGLDWSHVAGLAAVAVAALVVGLATFERRDLSL